MAKAALFSNVSSLLLHSSILVNANLLLEKSAMQKLSQISQFSNVFTHFSIKGSVTSLGLNSLLHNKRPSYIPLSKSCNASLLSCPISLAIIFSSL